MPPSPAPVTTDRNGEAPSVAEDGVLYGVAESTAPLPPVAAADGGRVAPDITTNLASRTWASWRDYCRRHGYAFAVGLTAQLLVMPALAYASTRAFRLTGVHARGLITLGCAPGGTPSAAQRRALMYE